MDLRQLRYVVTLADCLNFRKASDRLNITQSALSRSIQALEQEYDVRLFDRNNASVHLTSIGRLFLEHAQSILKGQAKLDNFLRQTASGAAGEIAIGMSPIAAKAFLAPLLSSLVETPGFHAHATITGPKELLRLIVEEKIELCVTASHRFPANAPLSKILLGRFPYGLLVRTNHPLADRAIVTPGEVGAFPLLASDHVVSTDDDAPPIFRSFGARRPTVSVENYDTLLEITLASDAVWATAPVAVSREIASGSLRKLAAPWMETHRFDLFSYQLRGRDLAPIGRRVLQRLQTLAQERLE